MVKVKTPTDLWMAKNLSDMKLWFLSESEYFISIYMYIYICRCMIAVCMLYVLHVCGVSG